MKKGTVFTVFVALLYLAFIGITMGEYFRGLSEFQASTILIGIGIATLFFGMKISSLDKNVNVGLMWGGALVTLSGIMIYAWTLSSDIRPIIIGGVLIGVIYIGNKYKRYLK